MIYLDLHGVLADFTGDALELVGVPRANAKRITSYGGWSAAGAPDDLWQRVLDRGWRFCAEQTLLPWAHELLRVCQDTAPTVIMTAPYSPDSAKGVTLWRGKHAPGTPLAIVREKWLLAHPGALLVDDKESTVEAFREAGGRAVLFPAPWNSARDKTVGDAMREVRRAFG